MKNKITVIMYHYVRELKRSRFPEIKGLEIKKFEEQIKYLLENYTVISMEELIESIDKKKLLPNNAAILTFDDGYKDNFTYVLPILLKYGIKGAFYITTKCIEEKKVLDVNKIHFLLASEENKSILVQKIYNELDKYRKKYKLKENNFYYEKLAKRSRFDNEEVCFIKKMLQVELERELREIILDKLFKEYIKISEEVFSEELYLTPDQIVCMQKLGMHIGVHTYSHLWLNSLTKEEQEREIELSINYLKKIGLNTEKLTICYPYGGFNEDTIEVVKNLNIKLGFTVIPEIAEVSYESRFLISRLDTNDISK